MGTPFPRGGGKEEEEHVFSRGGGAKEERTQIFCLGGEEEGEELSFGILEERSRAEEFVLLLD